MEKPKECFKTSVGGQALMEGIMMRGPEKICCAEQDKQPTGRDTVGCKNFSIFSKNLLTFFVFAL